MPLAMSLMMKVLPAFGGETMRPRWPRPMGAMRLMMRCESLSDAVSMSMSSSGKTAVSCSKCGRRLATSGLEAVDRLDALDAVVLLGVLGRAHRAGDVVAGAQAEAAHVGLGDVDVVDARKVVLAAQEAVAAFVEDLEHAGAEDLAFALCLIGEDVIDEVWLSAVVLP